MCIQWCWADYTPDHWDRPAGEPGGAKHEHHYGLIRPDGIPKPHADVLRAFAATNPMVMTTPRDAIPLAAMPTTAEYYTDPKGHCVRLYSEYLAFKGSRR